MCTVVEGLYAGQPRIMPGTGRLTAFFKQPVSWRVHVGRLDLFGDAQADLRVHGGPEKAVHHFPFDNYAHLAALEPEHAAQFVRGSMAENFSTTGFAEADVCLGDVFAFGSARIQVSQPRTPCWKIDARFGVEDLALRIERNGVSGWYYRVLEEGEVEVGDDWCLIDRNADPITLRRFWELKHATRPDLDALRRLRDTPGLASRWQRTLRDRVAWLEANALSAGT
ncbi:MAG: MOSC domain-containing protein [Nevskiaceae bacterium]|nr:MAG: MOSC domain-containing protein [Nevskiaceae bacterium]TBR72280.1 MAG: MOSC domain-containing protein [Nevskiaceae bacterium]